MSAPDAPTPLVPGNLTYADALAALEARGRYGIRMGLGRVRALLRDLGDPQLAMRGALVAGTNGKGSVIALAGSALRAAGYRTAETPKPHLVTYRERIVVDGRPISPEDFARGVAAVLPHADKVARRLGPLTEFELLTAVMFRHFAMTSPDVALVEVGLGGRLDATHAWDGGVAVVTNVAFDHTDRLGTTLEAIARQKAAIIDRGDRAVTGTTGDALGVVRRRCLRLGVPLAVVAPAPVLEWTRDTLTVDLPRLGPTAVGLRGRHQGANVAVADALLDALELAGIATVSDEARRRGYAEARWAGRLEFVDAPLPGGGTREVLLDGAHNPAGAAALGVALDELLPHFARGGAAGQPALTVVWGSMSDKDVPGVISAMAGCAALVGATVICTSLNVPRALPASELAAVWRAAGVPGLRAIAADDADAALDLALRTGEGTVVVAGSLYLVGAARARFVADPALRDPEAS